MAFPDWPLSNGSLNPAGWLTQIDKLAEHSHRLSAGVMSIVTIILAIWVSRTDSRSWLRKLSWFAVGLVLAQAVVGGLRVLYNPQTVDALGTSVGRLFAMLHACLAQLFVCTLIAIAVAVSRGWTRGGGRHAASGGPAYGMIGPIGRVGRICCGLLFLQLAIAAVVRHSFAWSAMPTFPFSTADGGLLPASWDFRVGIHFAHRVMALVLALAIPWFAVQIWRSRSTTVPMKLGAVLLVALLIFQITLGALIILRKHSVTPTTGHVLVGAFTLATTFFLTWLAHRDAIANSE